MTQKGFTLIEALVVIGVLAVVGFVMTDLLSRTLLGGNKIELSNAVKQNGERALSLMDSTIRGADQVICVGNYPSSSFYNNTITVTKGGILTRFRIYSPSGGANGMISVDNPVLANPTSTSTICTTDNQSSPQTFTNTDPVTGVSVSSCPASPQGCFYWTPRSGFKDVVAISFFLSPGVNGGTGSQNQLGSSNSINFSTSIELR